jgi:hypothetical protein
MSFYDDASLMLLASGGAQKDGKVYSVKPTDGAGDFTFTRGSNLSATRVDADGLIEKGRENLLTQSNTFNSTDWISIGVTPTSGQSGYDGTNDAWLLTSTANYKSIVQNVSSSGVNTFSTYLKDNNIGLVQLNLLSGGFNLIDIDLTAGVITGQAGSNIIDKGIESIGNGWYRVYITVNASITSARITFNDLSGTSFFIQDAQLEIGLAATEVIESGATTGKAGILEDTPRFDYSGGATCPSLLLEPSRTNLIKNSEYLNGVEWNGKINVSFGTNQTISPEGLLNSASIIENTTNGSHFAYEDFTLTSGTTYTISIYAKKNGTNRNLRFSDGGLGWSSGFTALFNLTAGTATGGDIESVGNDWYRCSVTGTTNATTCRLIIYSTLNDATSYQGDGTSGVFLYGFQIEQGSYATSYIPNHSGGGSQTRAQDVCSKTGISSLIGQTEGTIYWEIDFVDVGNYTSLNIRGINDGDRILIQRRGNNNYLQTTLEIGYVSQVNYTNGAAVLNGVHKIAFIYSENNFKTYLDGVLVGSDTSGSTFTNQLNNIFINPNSSAVKTKQVLVFPTALSDADLATLTTI